MHLYNYLKDSSRFCAKILHVPKVEIDGILRFLYSKVTTPKKCYNLRQAITLMRHLLRCSTSWAVSD